MQHDQLAVVLGLYSPRRGDYRVQDGSEGGTVLLYPISIYPLKLTV